MLEACGGTSPSAFVVCVPRLRPPLGLARELRQEWEWFEDCTRLLGGWDCPPQPHPAASTICTEQVLSKHAADGESVRAGKPVR